MSGWLKLILQVGIVSVSISAAPCFAKGTPMNTDSEEESHEQSWNREQKSSQKQEARALVLQKAESRAEQRNDRLASSAWYGISNSRLRRAAQRRSCRGIRFPVGNARRPA